MESGIIYRLILGKSEMHHISDQIISLVDPTTPFPARSTQFLSYCRMFDLGDNFSTYILLNYGQIIS
jgi:hypothetical protein